MIIRMTLNVSGGRADGSSWPPVGQPFEVDDAEGAHLCRVGQAVFLRDSDPVPLPPFPDPPPDPAPADTVPETPAAEDSPPPAPAAPKQAWVDYAVAQGMPADRAAVMSKADLMSRYGGRV